MYKICECTQHDGDKYWTAVWYPIPYLFSKSLHTYGGYPNRPKYAKAYRHLNPQKFDTEEEAIEAVKLHQEEKAQEKAKEIKTRKCKVVK